MKRIFKIHPLTYIIALLAVLTANFKIYLILMLLIVIHELGHVLAGLYFHWNLKEIIVLPMGMISKYNNLINTPMNEEIVVASMGVIFQLVFYLLFFKKYSSFYMGNLVIIVFNLLPIWPLDGSKILNTLLNKFLSFKMSYLISIYISFICVFVITCVIIIKRDLILFIIFIPLLIGLFKEYCKIPSIINKFYLERYLYNFSFDRVQYIQGIKLEKMKKGCLNVFIDDQNILKEKEVLRKRFD